MDLVKSLVPSSVSDIVQPISSECVIYPTHIPILLKRFTAFDCAFARSSLLDLTGSIVNVWKTINGTAGDVIQLTQTNKPQYQVDALNGLPAIVFDGTNDFLQNLSFPNISTVTMFVVGKYNTTPTNQGMVDISTFITNTGAQLHYEAGIKSHFRIKDSVGLKDATLAESLPIKHIFTGVADGTDIKYFVDGDLKQTTLAGTISETVTNLDIGRLSGINGFFLNGAIGEVIIYGRALSGSERQEVLDYLSPKWKIPLI